MPQLPANRILRGLLPVLVIVACLAPPLFARPPAAKLITPALVRSAPALDGTLSDPAWNLAPIVSGFTQNDPDNGRPATERTEVRVLYTRTTVYFGVNCRDSRPGKIIANQLIRDATQGNDDQFTVVIDPTGGGQNGYLFSVNPRGTQQDALIGEEGGLVDYNWNGVWYSAAKIGKDGWTAEIAIPFSTLNFVRKNATWRINFQRVIRHKQEVDLWAAWQRIYGIFKLSRAGTIGPFRGIQSARLNLLKPYVETYAQRNPPTPFSLFGNAGLDYEYGLTSNFTTDLTINPDFSETPPDNEQVNTSPIPLYLPEDRSFFLEREDIFSVNLGNLNQLFFSRNIGIDPSTGGIIPVTYGLKADGSIGSEDAGALAIQEDGDGFPATDFYVERLKQRLDSGSYFGFLGIEKESQDPDDPENDTWATDYNLNFFNSALNLQGFFAKTYTPGMTGNDWGGVTALSYNSDWIQANIFKEVQLPNFNPEVGYRQFTDDSTTGGSLTFIYRPHDYGIRQINFYTNPLQSSLTNGSPYLGQFNYGVYALFNSGANLNLFLWNPNYWNLTSAFEPFSGATIQPGKYKTNDHTFSYSSDSTKPVFYTFGCGFGLYYTGPYQENNFTLNWRPNAHFLANYSRSETDYQLSQGRYEILQQILGLTYAFSGELNFQAQYENINVALPPSIMSARFDYHYRPDSDFYLIYNRGPFFVSSITGLSGTAEEERYEVKWTYAVF